LRILIVHSHVSVVGGAETYLLAAIRELLQRGHEVAMLHEFPAGEHARVVDARSPVWCLVQLGAEKALSAVKEWDPAILFVHHWQAPEVEQELIARYPAIFFAHDYNRTCPTGRKSFTYPDRRPCTRQAGPACLLLHHARRCGGLSPLTAWRGLRSQSLHLSLLTQYQAVLAGSTQMMVELRNHGIESSHLHLVPLFPPNAIPDSASPSVRVPAARLLMVGRLVDVKGADYLIESMPLVSERLGREPSLVIAGSGPEEARLRELAKKLHADVRFAGWMTRTEITTEMRNADLLVLPGVWPEPFGLAGFEAGSVGLPAVAFAVGGVKDWLIPGVSGELAPAEPPTFSGLADAIVRALSVPDHYEQLCKGAWEIARKYSVTAHVDKLESVLDQVTNATRICA